jgi:hypothetical protein
VYGALAPEQAAAMTIVPNFQLSNVELPMLDVQ